MTEKDQHYMQLALDLAFKGKGSVSPNPMVGCVIVHDDEIIGQGYHQRYGEAHAEVNAVNSVKDLSQMNEATVFVTLEPCAHTGKTPPCADLLVKYHPKRVVICNDDPNPKVAGRGIEKLVAAGIEVVRGVLEKKGRDLNKRFFTFQEKRRPYVILKWAQTVDGFVARENFDSKWISSEASRKLVHQWRAEEDAIMVGKNTAAYDNPQLNVRDVEGKNPIRIVLDRSLSLDSTLNLFDQSQKTIIFNSIKNEVEGDCIYVKLDYKQSILSQLLNYLYEHGIMSLFVEGGSQLLATFLDGEVWDEVRVFKSLNMVFGKGIVAPSLPHGRLFSQNIDNDRLEYYVKS